MILYTAHSTTIMNNMEDSRRLIIFILLFSLIYGIMILILPLYTIIGNNEMCKYKTNLWYMYIVDLIVTWIRFKYKKEAEIESKKNIIELLKEKNRTLIYQDIMNKYSNKSETNVEFPIYVNNKKLIEFKP